MNILFRAIDPCVVAAIRYGGTDAYGQAAERRMATAGQPCRHRLKDVTPGQEVLRLAFRPFPAPQPYGETRPIFLCATCERAPDSSVPPPLPSSPDDILRGYGSDHRIADGTGRVGGAPRILAEAAATLADPDVADVHVRSAQQLLSTAHRPRLNAWPPLPAPDRSLS